MFTSSDFPWFIVNENDDSLFWSNEYGWVDYYSADSFDDDEHKVLNLPANGKWFCFLDSKNLTANFYN